MSLLSAIRSTNNCAASHPLAQGASRRPILAPCPVVGTVPTQAPRSVYECTITMNMKFAFNLAKPPAKIIYERLRRLDRTTLSIPEDARAVGQSE